jgi:hypothetical protein
MNMETLALAVRSNFKSLHEAEIISRVALLSGRGFTQSCKGYKIMVEKKMLPEGFIKAESLGLIFRWIEQNPAIAEAFDRLDMIPVKVEKGVFKFDHPKPLTVEEIRIRLQCGSLDF